MDPFASLKTDLDGGVARVEHELGMLTACSPSTTQNGTEALIKDMENPK